ncbi:MAG: tetratricopeptide repeat protein [Myxococcota bacterium]
METDFLRAELERLFELPELLSLSKNLLGFEPEAIGGTATKASFAGALAAHCLEQDAVEALCDALLATRLDVSERVAKLTQSGLPAEDDLAPGVSAPGFNDLRRLGEGRLGVSYLAQRDGREYRLKVLRHEATRDKRGLHRFLTLTRLVARLEHPSLPRGLEVLNFSSRIAVAHEHVRGRPLAERVGRVGAMHWNEVRDVLRAVLEALAALHAQRLSHGDLRLDNVILVDGVAPSPAVLVDIGGDRLRARPRLGNGRSELFSTVSSPKCVAPEQIQGQLANPRSDVYSFGALLYEVLTGKAPFAAKDALEAAFGHLSTPPAPPSSLAPRGFVLPALDEFVLGLLAKDPKLRPADAAAVLEAFDQLRSRLSARKEPLSESALNELIEKLGAAPRDEEVPPQLESAAAQFELAPRVADALLRAADELSDETDLEAKKSLLFRAGRVCSAQVELRARAEEIYARLHILSPDDAVAETALIELRRKLGKLEEVVEMLLARAERAKSREEKARHFAEIGRLYLGERGDREQALVAFTQAFSENPADATLATEIERLAGSNPESWNEVLNACSAAAADESTPAEERTLILTRAGRWWLERAQRPDLALTCFQAVVAVEPAHEAALEGMAQIYRKSLQWSELGQVLMRRADAARTPAEARNLRSEAAELLASELGDEKAARALFEEVVAADPAHPKALPALLKLHENTGDYAALVALLDRQLPTQKDADRVRTLTRIGEICEAHLENKLEAARHFELALDADKSCLEALRGLERLHQKAGRFKELLENLYRQVELSPTPRQKVRLLERIAAIYGQEFLDHEKAAETLEQLLAIDPAHEGAFAPLARHYKAIKRFEEVASCLARHAAVVSEPSQRLALLLEQARTLADPIGAPERALRVYEAVLALEPTHAESLDAVAKLKESSGDADAALVAIEALAAKAQTPEGKAEQWLRAARLLEGRGDRDGAIERYKQAIDANPKDATASRALREAYAARGDVHAAIQLLEREIESSEGELSKAALAGKLAVLCREKLHDDKRAEEAARRALDWDPSNVDAVCVMADIAFENRRFVEASRHYEAIQGRVDRLPNPARLLIRYVDSLAQTGSTEKALAAMDTLLRLAPDDAEALQRAAEVTFEHGSAARAAELFATLLERFGAGFDHHTRARILEHRGEALRRAGRPDEALAPLEEASELDSSAVGALVALAKVHEAAGRWNEVIKVKTRRLDSASGNERVELLFEIGEIWANKLSDRAQAAKNFVAALDERPDDRRVLTRLMQLYSEDKDWNKLVGVVLRLAEFVDDPKQRVKYLHTAAIVTARQIGDVERAIEFYEQVLELEPAFDKALVEVTELERARENHTAVERLLKRRLELATAADDQKAMITTFEELGDLYEKKLGWTDQAVDAYEAAHTLDSSNVERGERLARLYASDPAKYLEKAVNAEHEKLRQNPFRVESYRALRRLYTETKQADAAFCLCQALAVLNLAEPDEERFYKRMRAETAAPAQNPLSDDGWLFSVMHHDADPLLTSVFALIEAAVIARRGQSISDLGYDVSYQVNLEEHPAPICQSIFYAAGVLGIPLPPAYQNENDPGGISFLFAHDPSFVLGAAALEPDVPLQPAAFVAAQSLTYMRPGMYLRHLLSSGTALKAWLFAAIKLTAPQFPVQPELEGAVNEALSALEAGIQGQVRDHLTRVVAKLLTSGAALDLKRWVKGVDLTADRAGLIAAHDLEMALRVVRASDDNATSLPVEERVKELVLYSVSPEYFQVRQKLGIAVDS